MQNIGTVTRATLPLRAAFALLLVFGLYMMPNAAFAQAAKSPVPVVQPETPITKANAAEMEQLVEQTKAAVFDKTVAEAKSELMAAGNSRMEVLIGAFGILITLLVAALGLGSYWQAGIAAAKAAKDEISGMKEELVKIRDSAQADARHIRQLSEESQNAVDAQQNQGNTEIHLAPDQQNELAQAALAASEIPRDQRTAQDFRVLMFQARHEEKWQDYVDLAEGMAYLHGDNADDLAFALFGKAIGQDMLKNYELASIYWADYFTRCPDDDANSRASALNNWGSALSDQAKTKQGAAADALFAGAGEKIAAALAIKPDKHEALSNWGSALLKQAAKHRGKKRGVLLEQAEEKLLRAEHLMPGKCSYNLACVYALRGDAAKAADWLKKAKDAGTNCPDCAHIADDADFDAVRDAPEFVQALADIGC